MNKAYVCRRLFWIDEQQQRQSLDEDELSTQPTPVVVLAEPGGGKSELLRHMALKANAPLVTATKWLRTACPEALIQPGQPIFIDALDEASARRDGDAIQKVLEKLDIAGTPRFVLSCRAADWEVRAATGIKQDYGVKPLVCHLEPFTRSEAQCLLGQLCPDHDASALLSRLEEQGLATLSSSPLTLQLIAKVVLHHGDLPRSRAALYDAAIKAIWTEHDPDRSDNRLAMMVEADALDVAGAICAALLMSGCEAVETGGSGQTGQGAISIHDVRTLPGAGEVHAVLGSKLFRLEEPGRLIPFHRTLAEYLGARWLARRADRRTRSRLLARLQPGGSVPARVRGLHAWLPYFDQELGRSAIDCDPFGIIRYGDVDALPLATARELLSSLVTLAMHDPYFRAGDWASHPLGALMRPEMAADIDALIGSSDANSHLRSLLIEGMRGTPLARQLGGTLETIVRDPARYFSERQDALEALEDWQDADWKLAIMEDLRREGTQDTTRLAAGMLRRIGPAAAGTVATADILAADIGLTICAVPRERDRIPIVRSYHRIVDAVPQGQVASLLDLLGDYGTMSHQQVDWSAENDLADVIVGLARRILPTLPTSDAPRVWGWLRPLGKADNYHREALKSVEAIMADRSDLRQEAQRYVAFDLRPRADIAMTIHADLGRMPGLRPSNDDIAALLMALSPADRDDARTRDDWRVLTDMLRESDIFPEELVPAALAFAGNDVELLAHLESVRRPRPPRAPFEWEVEHTEKKTKRHADRAVRFAKHRAEFIRNRKKLRAGDPDEIRSVAEAYVNNFSDLSAKTAVERLETWLGPELAKDAFIGLEAVLYRDDLPDLVEVSVSRAECRAWYIGFAALAGVMERLRRQETLHDVPDRALLLANLHREWSWNADSDRAEATRKALDEALLNTRDRFEKWHRLHIEPQLQRRCAHVSGLHDVTHDARFPDTAQKLLREWVIAYPDLPHEIECEMVDALIRVGDHTTVREVSSRRLTKVLPDRSSAIFWLAADWITDPEQGMVKLAGIGANAPDFLLSLRERLGLDRHQPTRPTMFPIVQREWLIEEFRSAWPLVSRFDDDGSNGGYDAAELIRTLIDRLAADPGGDAGAALDRLAAASCDSYTDALLHAAAAQRQLRSETEFRPICPPELGDLLADGPPSDIDELRVLVLDELTRAQARLRGSDTDRVVEFWSDHGRPRDENRCRDRLADLIEPALERYGVQRIPERNMPQNKRADLAFARGTMQLPMEIKGQWHPEVWDAATGQLDRLYLRDWRSEDRGIYVVLWFGDVPSVSGRRLKLPPSGNRPATPQEMEDMLRERLPAARRAAITVRVVDLTR